MIEAMVRRGWIGFVLLCACAVEPEDDSDVPESCRRAAYGTACEMDYVALCASRSYHEDCEQTDPLEGGPRLECTWIVPNIVVDADACVLEYAAGRCVAIDYPGDTDCTMWIEDGDQTLVAALGRCYPVEWNNCEEQSSPACACLER
jgi:hypothetical protein